MKNILAVMAAVALVSVSNVRAQDVDNFYDNMLGNKEVKAKDSAGKLLDSRTKTYKIDNNKVVVKRAQKTVVQKPINERLVQAPFGLYWGAKQKEIKDMSVFLATVDRKGLANVFVATNLPKPIGDFTLVEVVFESEDELNRIIAFSEFVEDDAKASKVLALYNKYYKLLEEKYGKGNQVFVPKINIIEETSKDKDGKPVVTTREEEEPIGGDDFLNSLKNADAKLYASFENKDNIAALGINVNNMGQTQITIDYRDKNYLAKKQKKTLEAL